VDATVRFLEEFTIENKKPSPTQQPPQQAVREIPGEDDSEEEKNEHSAVHLEKAVLLANASEC
jgi:hypothetical protein